MQSRDDLHTLLDALPDASLEHAERVLKHCLTWPQPSTDVQELKRKVHERVHEVEMAGRHNAYDRRVPGEIRIEPGCIPPGTGYVSHMSWIQDELVQVTLLRVRDQIVERVERVGVTNGAVRYSADVRGPDGKLAPFTAEFREAQ